jgi:hypothetical protein
MTVDALGAKSSLSGLTQIPDGKPEVFDLECTAIVR